MDYIPYVYRIGWSQHNIFYIGCQYAWKNSTANPKNLWSTYFTSSKRVKNFRSQYGEPDIFEILFECNKLDTLTEKDMADIVCQEEIKLLKHHNAKLDQHYLNASDSLSFRCNDEISNEKRRKHQNSRYAKDPEYRNKISEGVKRAHEKDPLLGKKILNSKIKNGNLYHSNESKLKMKKSAQIRANTPEGREKLKMAAIHQQLNMSIDDREKRSKMVSDRFKGIKKNKIMCPHCGKEGAPNVMSRWHFNKCKSMSTTL